MSDSLIVQFLDLLIIGAMTFLPFILIGHCIWKVEYNAIDNIDTEYKRNVMRSILPKNPGISIDKVAEALKDEDLGEFHLTHNSPKNP